MDGKQKEKQTENKEIVMEYANLVEEQIKEIIMKNHREGLPLKEPPSKSNLCESFLESFLLY